MTTYMAAFAAKNYNISAYLKKHITAHRISNSKVDEEKHLETIVTILKVFSQIFSIPHDWLSAITASLPPPPPRRSRRTRPLALALWPPL